MTNRDGINWPGTGSWAQDSLTLLRTLGEKLEVPKFKGGTDILTSVPTPWARALLFESALYDEDHPSRHDVEDQWRGLLGMLALAKPLGIESTLVVTPFNLDKHVETVIGSTMSLLRPTYITEKDGKDVDEEEGKWKTFHLIIVEEANPGDTKKKQVVLGATSPRTLVFTSADHKCPPSIPFHNEHGRLSDPVVFYKQYEDTQGLHLGMLATWIDNLLEAVARDDVVANLLGKLPAPPGASRRSRREMLKDSLKSWKGSLEGYQRKPVAFFPSRFSGSAYELIKGVEAGPQNGAKQSDLLLEGRNDVIAVPDPKRGCVLVGPHGENVETGVITIWTGQVVQVGQPLPRPFSFLPKNVTVLEPADLFEDRLIAANLVDDATFCCKVENHKYLYPFKPEILEYLDPSKIAESTVVVPEPRGVKVQLDMPLVNQKRIRATRSYTPDEIISLDPKTHELYPTSGLALWPDFISEDFKPYFYFKKQMSPDISNEVDFKPVVEYVRDGNRKRWIAGDSKDAAVGKAGQAESKLACRPKDQKPGGDRWYAADRPIPAFSGRIQGHTGVLLLKPLEHKKVEKGNEWHVSVDLGSTHTRAFYVRPDPNKGGRYSPGDIHPLEFTTHSRLLTESGQEPRFKPDFFALQGTDHPPLELKTLCMMPEAYPEQVPVLDYPKWLPREGFAYLHWIYSADYDEGHLRADLKWSSNNQDFGLRSYLNCLLLMVQAEAAKKGALVKSVRYSYPSVFTRTLTGKHKDAWDTAREFAFGPQKTDQKEQTPATAAQDSEGEQVFSEAVAVCRYLQWFEGAPVTENVISLDVGGSTTDFAIWAGEKLQSQQSVKIATDVVGHFLQSNRASRFLRLFADTLQDDPYRITVNLHDWENRKSGYILLFNNILGYLESRGMLDRLVGRIMVDDASRDLMAYLILLFGSVSYFAGLLGRKQGLAGQRCHVYFCGKGGKLVEWIPGWKQTLEPIFLAGLNGSDAQNASVQVDLNPPTKPKEEVGRGLLALSRLAHDREGAAGMEIYKKKSDVIVGETGYSGLDWDGPLNSEKLQSLPDKVPTLCELRELSNFLKAFREGRGTKGAAEQLGIHSIDSDRFATTLKERLFGQASGRVVHDLKHDPDNAILEPLFITEVKVLWNLAGIPL
jgi:hypothetical protein